MPLNECQILPELTGKPVDAGIAPAHWYIVIEEIYPFFQAEDIPKVSCYAYIGSVTR